MTLSPRDLAVYLAARLVPALAAMALTMLCIHSLEPEVYASYSVTLLTVGVAVSLAGGASAQAMLRYANELSPVALRRGLIAFPLMASALACPVALMYLAHSGGLSASAWLAVALIPALALLDTRRSLFVARARASLVFALDSWRAVLALVLTGVLLQASGPYAAIPILAQLLAIGVGLLLVWPTKAADPGGGSRTVDSHYVGYGLGLASWMAVIVGLSLAERSIVANAGDLAASGRYAAQADIINAAFAAAGGALGSAMLPAYLAQSRVQDATAMRRLLKIAIVGTLVVSALCLAFGVMLSISEFGRLSRALTDDRVTAVALVAAAAVWMAAGFVQKPLELRGRSRGLVACVLAALLLFLLIAPALTERLGSPGVAAGKMIAGLAFCALVMAVARWSR